MKKNIFLLSIIVVIACVSSVTIEHISYTDINSKYAITGPLGLPLGETFECEVKKIETNTKQNLPSVQVTSINGKSFEKPVAMTYHLFLGADKMEIGKTYKCKAYQDGGFTGTPQAVLKEIMVQSTNYFFQVELVIYKIN